jgi:rfaE bifunctional protein kinase chain/domain
MRERLKNLVREFAKRRVLVVGDLLADQFLYGEISRVSREAPVLILRHERTETVPGGAANCAMNLASLGAQAAVVGVVGTDAAGDALLDKLGAAGVDCEQIVRAPEVRTTTKVRILAGQAHSMRQQVIRVDYEGEPPSGAQHKTQLAARLNEAAARADAIIISDYNYGVVDAETIATLREAVKRREAAEQRLLPVLVDSRFRLLDFTGFTSATPNEDEVEQVLGRRIVDTPTLESAAAELRERLGHRALLITRGNQGMLLLEEGAPPQHIAPVGSHEAVDVTGAGDTVIAAYTLGLVSGASFADAAHLANRAGGIVVMKRGTASVEARELLSSIEENL